MDNHVWFAIGILAGICITLTGAVVVLQAKMKFVLDILAEVHAKTDVLWERRHGS